MKKSSFAFALGLAALCIAAMPAVAQIAPKPLSLIVSKDNLMPLKAMTVKITTFSEDGNQIQGGTGLLVGHQNLDYFVVTAKHVVEGSERIFIPLSLARGFDAVMLDAHQTWDLAVLRFTADRDLPVEDAVQVQKVPADVVGAQLMAIGYPVDVCEVILDGFGLLDENYPPGVEAEEFFAYGEQLIKPGFSGGPVFDEKSQLLGMCFEATQESGGGVRCLKYSYILQHLKNLGVPFQFLKEPPAEPVEQPAETDPPKTNDKNPGGQGLVAPPVADPLVGTWLNTNSQTTNITRVVVTQEDQDLYIQVFGRCHPTDCDWGKQALAEKGANQYITFFDPQFRVTTMEFTLSNGRLTLLEKSVYRDARKPSEYTETFRPQTERPVNIITGRKIQTKPTTEPVKKPAEKPVVIATDRPVLKYTSDAPTPLSPDNGKVFNNFPRTTTLSWKPVTGAVSYIVELDCMGCCAAGKWCNEVGKTYQLKADIPRTSYTFDWVGAQKGRWRVWAKKSDGKVTAKSGWREFSYTR